MDESTEQLSERPVINTGVAAVLRQISEMLEFLNENSFKIRSYQMAAETIDAMQDSVAELASKGGAAELQKIPGIGKTISAQIIEIIDTGKSAYLQELAGTTPITVLNLRRVSGIGLRTAQTLYHDFGITSLAELRQFAEGGGLLSVPGIGEKSTQRILRSLDRLRDAEQAATGSE